MSKRTTILVVALAVIAIVALLAVWLISRGGEETPVDPLAGSKWQARSYCDPAVTGGMASPLAGTQLTAGFADGKVAGSSGCNTYTAPYTVSGKSLTVGPPVLTKLTCPEDVAQQGQAYIATLQLSQS